LREGVFEAIPQLHELVVGSNGPQNDDNCEKDEQGGDYDKSGLAGKIIDSITCLLGFFPGKLQKSGMIANHAFRRFHYDL